MDTWITTLILLATLYLLITEKISVALTAIGIIVLLVVSNILSPKEAVAGFSALGLDSYQHLARVTE
jgi:di/tricarboxylate transporter